MKHQVTLVRFGGMRRFVATLVASAALIFALVVIFAPVGVISASASMTSSGRISAHLTKTRFRASEAGKVKLVYRFSSQSVRFAYGLWRKTGANWRKLRGVSTRGSLHGSHTMTVKRLFGPRPVKVGHYRLRVSDAANSVTLTFAVIKASSPGSPSLPSAPGAFGKTSPNNGANGQLNTPSLSWAASTNAISYQYCVDTTNNNTCDGSWVSTSTQTSASLTGLTLGTTYYWQVEAINAQGTVQADNAVWFAFTVAGPTAGVWLNTGVGGAYYPVLGVNFTVDPSGATVVRFVVLYNISACGPQSAWTATPSPIAGASFVSPDATSWRSSQSTAGGGGVFAGTFDSPTSAHGTAFFGGFCTTFNQRYSFSTGTFSWTATWHSSG